MSDVAVIAEERILVADDDPSILRLVAALLTRACYRVDTAVTGREALEKIELTQYDAVVLDLMMPDMSGLEVLARLQTGNRHPRFVVIMSAASPSIFAEAMSPNVFATLRKPFDIDELVAKVRACIAARNPRSSSGSTIARQLILAPTSSRA